jgi:hypothetical protein
VVAAPAGGVRTLLEWESEMQMVEEFLIFLAWGWFLWFTYTVVIGSRRAGRAQVKKLQQAGFSIDYMLKGNIYVLFDHTKRKIAFVFRDASFVYDYADIKSLTRNWVNLAGLKLKNGIVFALQDKKFRCGNLSHRQAEYWHPKLAALIGA